MNRCHQSLNHHNFIQHHGIDFGFVYDFVPDLSHNWNGDHKKLEHWNEKCIFATWFQWIRFRELVRHGVKIGRKLISSFSILKMENVARFRWSVCLAIHELTTFILTQINLKSLKPAKTQIRREWSGLKCSCCNFFNLLSELPSINYPELFLDDNSCLRMHKTSFNWICRIRRFAGFFGVASPFFSCVNRTWRSAEQK